MTEFMNIAVPSRPEMVQESATEGTYEISGLHPGYGNTLGNALRRILLSSIPGVAITAIKIKGAPHEFSVLDGVKEDTLTVILRLKGIFLLAETDTFPQVIRLKKKGVGKVTAGDFELPTQIKVANKDLVIAEITDAKTELEIEAWVQNGIGFCPRENFTETMGEVGVITLDATFSPVRRSSYEVHNMRIGDRTDFNKLSIFIETDGTVTPREALNKSIQTMMKQLEAMLNFQSDSADQMKELEKETQKVVSTIQVTDLELSAAVVNNLEKNGIKTVTDIMKKGVAGIRDIPGIGEKAIEEIVSSLEEHGIVFKGEGSK